MAEMLEAQSGPEEAKEKPNFRNMTRGEVEELVFSDYLRWKIGIIKEIARLEDVHTEIRTADEQNKLEALVDFMMFCEENALMLRKLIKRF